MARKRNAPARVPASAVPPTPVIPHRTQRDPLRISRSALFAALVAVCVVVPAGYATWAASRAPGQAVPPAQEPGAAASARPVASSAVEPGAPDITNAPRIVFQHVARDEGYARLAVAPLDDPDGTRLISDLACERVYAIADEGLCLVPEGGLVTRYWAVVFGPDFKERTRIELSGSPSRARISADGRYGATTVFVFGHSYADAAFSTQTTIIDMKAGAVIDELEQFTAYRDGARIHAPDFNYWGVTFADDSNSFYATLRTAGQTYLVKGDIAAREVHVLRENVECPSLSPDGTRIGFKKLVGEPGTWRFTVLDLATMQETPLAETESVDDQLEWLDDERLVYGKAGGLWAIDSDGSGSPTLLVADALSPAVIAHP